MTGLEWLKAHRNYDSPDCLIWPLHKDTSNGYGRIGITKGGKKKILWAHRLMCELVHGPSPAGYEAAHSCGRGKFGCVHPKHLSWKTRSENQRDRRQHGTHGKRTGIRYKLTPEQVSQIRALKGLVPQQRLALIYDVSWQTIGSVQRGDTWKTGDYAMGRPRHRERAAS